MVCLICRRSSVDDLCSIHSRIYMYDSEYDWIRKKKRLNRYDRKRENTQKYHSKERHLGAILKRIFGIASVVSGVHPMWAVSSKGALLEFDFAIPDIKLLIERDGLQHIEFPNYFHKSRREFEEQRKRDKFKRKQAVLNGWTVLTIDHNIKISIDSVKSFLKETIGIIV